MTEIVQHPNIDTLVTAIDQRIEEAARNGLDRISEPEFGHSSDQVTPEQRIALRNHYESRGFKWHISKKAGHPCCRGLTVILW
ncbi:MAG TPA: hypothetical protein DEO88_18065 [Syntrophobacteraceae bacterium]|nr:hypothetical protein [Syntrophobacteraceae bacterium]